MDTIKKVFNTIESYKMIKESDSVLVGVSGGPDSIALLHILKMYSLQLSFSMGIAHLNHCLREDSQRDENFVFQISKEYKFPCFIEKRDVKKYQQKYGFSLEEAARNVRYNFLNSIALENGYNKIALGHHCDDNAELVLMNLLRGSAYTGLSGIPPVRDNLIIRPLIQISRNEILEYISINGLDFVTDETNFDRRFARNKVRYELIPYLKNYNPQITPALNRLSHILSRENQWIEKIVNDIFQKCLIYKDQNEIHLSIHGIKENNIAARRRLFRKAIKKIKTNLRRISLAHIDAVDELLISGSKNKSLNLPDNVSVIFHEKLVKFIKNKKIHSKANNNLEYIINGPGLTKIKDCGFSLKLSIVEKCCDFHKDHNIEFFDLKKITFPLILRNHKPGDRFTPLGMNGSQKIKKFFINNKIPNEIKKKTLVLLCQDKIIWLLGHRIDNSVRIDKYTKKIFKAEMIRSR